MTKLFFGVCLIAISKQGPSFKIKKFQIDIISIKSYLKISFDPSENYQKILKLFHQS